MAERRATLFDGMLVLCKRKRSSSTSGQAGANGAPVEYKLKDLILIRKVEIKDRDDTDGMYRDCYRRNMFDNKSLSSLSINE